MVGFGTVKGCRRQGALGYSGGRGAAGGEAAGAPCNTSC
jgi:hypothetical protein